MTFEKKLLAGTFIIISSFTIILAVLFYNYNYFQISNNEIKNNNQIAQYISYQLEMLYKQMDTGTISAVHNDELFNTIVNLNDSGKENPSNMPDSQSIISKSLYTVSTSVPQASRILIFNSEYKFFYFFGLSLLNREYIDQRLNDRQWYENLMPGDKTSAFSPPHLDNWSDSQEPVISIYRKFANLNYHSFGIIEIQVPYRYLQNICDIENSGNENQVFIFDENKTLIYPYNMKHDESDVFKPGDILNGFVNKGVASGVYILPDNRLLFSSAKTGYMGWTIIIASKQDALLRHISYYRDIIILAGIIILTLILTVFFILFNRLTRPLKELINSIEKINLNNMNLEVINSGHDEFKLLNASFNNMLSKLKDSINSLYESRIREVNAHFLALQAQMNPHFLYNTLNVIGATCEEEGSAGGAEMCEYLSAIMRYTVSNKDSYVNLADEIEITVDYLSLIMRHYEDKVCYNIDIPEKMYEIVIPKMTLQPLVENCINHGFENSRPPWIVNIHAQMPDKEKWLLVVEDNGSGFSQDVIKNMETQIAEYKENLIHGNFNENLNIGGMGILNTFSRLAILYKRDVVFSIENNENGGAKITIGGNASREGVDLDK